MKKQNYIKNVLNNNSGIALMTVILFLVFMMIVSGFVMYVVTRSIQISGSSRREYSAFEAAESGIEWGMLKIEDIANTGAALAGDTLNIDQKNVGIEITYLFAAPVSGSNISYASGYEGIGRGSAAGGSSIAYRILSNAKGINRENVEVEISYRKIVGISAR